jgi:hypothetical protein
MPLPTWRRTPTHETDRLTEILTAALTAQAEQAERFHDAADRLVTALEETIRRAPRT